MKTTISTLIITMFITIVGGIFTTLSAEEGVSIKLGDKLIPLSALNTNEQNAMIKSLKKINAAEVKKNTVANSIMDNIPTTTEGLNDWRKLITGTIKDVCVDLNITANEFVKTPVGMGIAGLIIYKIAGKDFLSKVIDMIIIIPIWLFIIGVSLIVSWYMLSYKTIYEIGDTNIKTPIRVERYEWNSKDAKCTFGCIMISIDVIMSLVTIAIIFSC